MEFARVYFNAEKTASFLFLIIGVISVVFSLHSWLSLKNAFYNGMAYPLLLIGIIEISVGLTIYWRTPEDLERIENYLTLEPERIQSEEIPRMEVVTRNFLMLRYGELFLIITGILMMFYISPSDLVKGIGFGLFLQAAAMLSADYFAERRGLLYLEQLRKEVSSLNKQS